MPEGIRRLSELIDSAQRIDQLGQIVPALLYVYDLLERRNVYTNRALADYLGYSAAQVRELGTELFEVTVHPDDIQRVRAHHARMAGLVEGAAAELEYRVRTAAGDFRWLQSWDTVLTRSADGGPRLLIGVAHDVTPRVTAEAALRESEARLADSEQRWRSIAENPFDFVVMIDHEYKYTYVNFTLDGLRSEDLIGTATPFDFVSPDQHALMHAAFERVFQHGEPASYEVHVPSADCWYSSLIGPIRQGDKVTHASILTREISAEKRLAVQARKAERRFRLAIEGAEEVLFDRDLETGEEFLAPHLLERLGFGSGTLELDVFGESFQAQLHPDDRAPVQAALRETLHGSLPFRHEFRLRDADGKHRWFSAQGRVVREAGEHDHFAGFLTDVSERKLREAALERKHAELERALEVQRGLEAKLGQAAKLEAVGRLAGGIAHDFNNLLTGINGVAELIGARLGAEDASARDLADLKQAVERGAGLTRQLLAFSRQQVVQPTVLDLNLLVNDTVRMLRRLIGENVELAFAPAAALWPVCCDPSQAAQVLLNLAVNSRDAMPNGGKLCIELRNVPIDAAYCQQQPDASPGDYVQLSVSDTGAGMPADTLALVFEPFFTTKALGQGTGLGLSMVYGIVRQAGGFVHVYSELGRGSTFKIYLPRAHGTPLSAPERVRTAPRGSETILLVEDDELTRRVVARALQSLGYQVRIATRGDDALALVEAGTPFDLLLSDVMLPGLDGSELCRRSALLRPGLRVMFMSGYTHNLIEEQGLLERGAVFLQKPFTTDDLAERVRSALDRPRERI